MLRFPNVVSYVIRCPDTYHLALLKPYSIWSQCVVLFLIYCSARFCMLLFYLELLQGNSEVRLAVVFLLFEWILVWLLELYSLHKKQKNETRNVFSFSMPWIREKSIPHPSIKDLVEFEGAHLSLLLAPGKRVLGTQMILYLSRWSSRTSLVGLTNGSEVQTLHPQSDTLPPTIPDLYAGHPCMIDWVGVWILRKGLEKKSTSSITNYFFSIDRCRRLSWRVKALLGLLKQKGHLIFFF